jgi:hypothetical protein
LITLESGWRLGVTSFNGSSYWYFQLNLNYFSEYTDNNWENFKSKAAFKKFLEWSMKNQIKAFKEFTEIEWKRWKLIPAINSTPPDFKTIARLYNWTRYIKEKSKEKRYDLKLEKFYNAYKGLEGNIGQSGETRFA